MARNPLENQIDNRNFLSPIGFNFNLSKVPKVNFFCNSARIPELTLGTAIQPSYLKDIDVPGDKLQYGDLSLRFLVDEELENYMAIHNWLTGLGFPESMQDFKDLTTADNGIKNEKLQFCDGAHTNKPIQLQSVCPYAMGSPQSYRSAEALKRRDQQASNWAGVSNVHTKLS